MFTDMVGYTAMAQADEGAALAALERHNRLLRPLFSKFHGREIKTVGDAFLVAFDSTLDAVHCAIEIQRALASYNAELPGAERTQVRIGVHVGDVVRRRGDLLGDTVNLASRLESLNKEMGSTLLVSDTVRQVAGDALGDAVALGPIAVRGYAEPVTVWRLA